MQATPYTLCMIQNNSCHQLILGCNTIYWAGNPGPIKEWRCFELLTSLAPVRATQRDCVTGLDYNYIQRNFSKPRNFPESLYVRSRSPEPYQLFLISPSIITGAITCWISYWEVSITMLLWQLRWQWSQARSVGLGRSWGQNWGGSR